MHVVALWVAALLVSAAIFATIGAYFLMVGLSSDIERQRSLEGPFVLVGFFAAVLVPLVVAAVITWRWFRDRVGAADGP